MRKIRQISGSENVQTAPEDMICYSHDGTTESGTPDLVVHPGSKDEVVSIIDTAREARIPVVPRGAGTGLSGGTLAARGGVVIHFDRMGRIKSLDPDHMLAVVEPGVINWDLKLAAKAAGLFYPPDPGSARFCTLGGNVAENAGGPYAARYGVTGDYVLGLEAVLASGETISTGSHARRDVAGYDLTSLIVGSEGTLAVVTEITLRLIPEPEARRTAFFSFADFNAAVDAVLAVTSAGFSLAALEILDQTTLACLDQYQPGQQPIAAAALLLEVDGESRCVEHQYDAVAESIIGAGGELVRTAEDEAGCEQLWDIRRAVSPALGRRAVSKIGEDISIPMGEIGNIHTAVREISDRHGIEIALFGHAGDGNLHPNFLTDRRDRDRMQRTRAAIGELFEATVELGGTLSGEHGIGTAKSSYMPLVREQETIELMRKMKRLFDPLDILNPGKIFPEP